MLVWSALCQLRRGVNAHQVVDGAHDRMQISLCDHSCATPRRLSQAIRVLTRPVHVQDVYLNLCAASTRGSSACDATLSDVLVDAPIDATPRSNIDTRRRDVIRWHTKWHTEWSGAHRRRPRRRARTSTRPFRQASRERALRAPR